MTSAWFKSVACVAAMAFASCARTNSSDQDPTPVVTAPGDTSGDAANRGPPIQAPALTAKDEGPKNPVAAAPAPVETTEQRLMWLEKVGQLLLHGETLAAGDILRYLGTSRQAVVNELMTRPSFIETTVDFGLYFLGFKANRLFYFNDFLAGSSASSEYAAAIHAAREVGSNGNFLALLDHEHPLFLTQLDDAQVPDRLKNPMADPAAPRPTPAEIRVIIRTELTRLWDEMETATTAADRDLPKFCSLLSKSDSGNLVGNYGLSFDTALRMTFSDTGPFVVSFQRCNFDSTLPAPEPDWTELNATVKRLRSETFAALDLVDSLVTRAYAPKSSSDLVQMDGRPLGISPRSAGFAPFAFWNRLQNSSTNYNRRRASYVLKRYFCDDLTPINVQVPADHASDRHGSDPSCQSCHYKLDPMAGFFRNIGFFGADLTGSPVLFFDDMASKPSAEYAQAWAAPAGSSRALNVGFIRSNVHESANSYGDNLQDLFAVIKTAPEARQCLVRRLYEYYVSPTQAFDGGYLEYLTQQFNEITATSGSAQAYRQTITTLLTSNGFGQTDPNSAQCYDYAPGDDPRGKPPCQIAAILQRNCASCHQGDSSAAGLNLAVWRKNERGEFSFPHRDIQDRRSTLGLVLDRLTSGDEQKRMPLKMDMPPADLDKLFTWLNKALSEGGAH